MAHYAILNAANVVTQVIVGKDEHEPGPDGQPMDWEAYYGGKRTSYNTNGGVHSGGGTPFRKNFAGIGFTYDPDLDAFVPPKPYSSWVLNQATAQWKAPKPMPTVGLHQWNEATQEWDEVAEETQP